MRSTATGLAPATTGGTSVGTWAASGALSTTAANAKTGASLNVMTVTS
jgi:hypothetical protein